MAVMKVIKRVGAMIHPWFIPVFAIRSSDSWPLPLNETQRAEQFLTYCI